MNPVSSGPGRGRRTLLLVIAVVTAISGSAQVIAPGAVLELLGSRNSGTSRQLFATVGMFMMVVGGLLGQTLLRPVPDPDVVLWTGLQKFGAFLAVSIGVMNRVFALPALGVALFDLATAVLLTMYWRGLPRVPRSGGGRPVAALGGAGMEEDR